MWTVKPEEVEDRLFSFQLGSQAEYKKKKKHSEFVFHDMGPLKPVSSVR